MAILSSQQKSSQHWWSWNTWYLEFRRNLLCDSLSRTNMV